MNGCGTLAMIRDRLARGPTVLDVEGEIAVARQLQTIPYEDVVQCHRDFDEITSALYMSHMDTYFEVTDQNIGPYLEFAAWLDGLGDFVGGEARESLRQLGNHFRTNSKDFKF